MLFLNIRSTQARIDLNINRGRMDINAPRGKWHMQHENAQCNLSVGRTVVELNSKPFYEQLERYKPDALYRKYAQEGKQGVIEGIERRMQEAEMFNKDGPRTNVIAELGRQAIYEPYKLVVGLKITPPADINVREGELQGSNDVGSLKKEYELPPIDFNYTPTTVNTYLKQQGSVRMWVTEGKYDIYA